MEGNIIAPKCVNTNCSDVTEAERNEIFTKFYRTGMTFDEQNFLILKNVLLKPKASSRAPKKNVMSRPKSISREYNLNGKKVCKGLFLATFCITNGRLQRTCKKYQDDPNTTPKDNRGKHGRQPKIQKDVIQILIDTINKIPKYVSHYRRTDQKDNTVYLQPGTILASNKNNENNVFHLFREECEIKGVDQPKITWFRQTMKTKFPHIKIKQPKSDQCNICEKANITNSDVNQHKQRALRLRDQQVLDKAKPNCLTFDLQQVQPLPDLLVNKAFYSRKM